jgi:cytoskeletal protein RodZ
MSSLGEKLKQAREARGVSISEIAEQTRISSHYLEAIESDDYRTLPGGIFNKGFVKSYAKYVGVDEQEALQDYAKIVNEQSLNQPEPEMRVHRPEVLTDSSRGSMLPTLIFAAVILGLMTWGILSAVNWWQEQQKNNAATANANVKTVNTPTLGTAATNANAPAGNTTSNTNTNTETAPVAAPGELSVQFKSISTEPVKPNLTSFIDGTYESYSFETSDTKTYNPQQTLKIAFSKWQVTNLQMTINGKPITLPAKPFNLKKQAIEFEINKSNIAQILQAGAITPESVGGAAPIANANTNVNAAKP